MGSDCFCGMECQKPCVAIKQIQAEQRELKMKVNDFVTILEFPEDHINHRARVTEIVGNGVYVTNMNMPFQGTFCNIFFAWDKIKEKHNG